MTYDWTILQTLLFIITPFFVMLAMVDHDDDSDDGGPGMAIPAYNPS